MWQVKTEMQEVTPRFLAGATDEWKCHFLTYECERERERDMGRGLMTGGREVRY
jgi:hypothetical protein